MGPAATADFLRRLVDVTAAEDEAHHVRVVVDSDPTIPSRAAYFAGVGGSPLPRLVEIATGLERLGADIFVMPCNSAQVFAEDVAAAVTGEFIDWIDTTVSAVAGENVRRVALLATSGAIEARLYHESLAARGIDLVEPSETVLSRLMAAIYGPEGIKAVGARSTMASILLDSVLHELAQRDDLDAVLVACTDISAMRLDERAGHKVPILDASQLVAVQTVQAAGGCVREPDRTRLPLKRSITQETTKEAPC
jgi:aspartate racemase